MTPPSVAVEPRVEADEITRMRTRLERLERLVRAIELELGDDTLDDELRVRHIGERVAGLSAP